MARKSIDEMVGEALREVGVLILVFAILDRLVAGSITWIWTVAAILISASAFLYGCVLERRRFDE